MRVELAKGHGSATFGEVPMIGVRHLGRGPWPSSYFSVLFDSLSLSRRLCCLFVVLKERRVRKRLDTSPFSDWLLIGLEARAKRKRRYSSRRKDHRDEGTNFVNHASSTSLVSAGSRDATGVAVRGKVRKEEESEGDERVHDSGALLKTC